MTEATLMALSTMRDLSMIKWYVIPLLAFVFYVYSKEIRLARQTGNWNAVFCGVSVFGSDFFNETTNGWIMVLSQRSALWTVPGDTALRVMVGWNIEIMFMFAILGIVYYNTLSESTTEKVFGIPEKWFWAIGYSAFCVFVEVFFLNRGNHLVWEYPFWEGTLVGVPMIFLFGYFDFFLSAILVLSLKAVRSKIIAVSVIYSIPITMNIIAFGFLGWNY